MRKTLLFATALLSAATLFAQKDKNEQTPAPADTTKKTPPPPSKPTIREKTKGSRKIEGLFTFYQDTVTGSLQMYVKKDQIHQDFIYQSFSLGGPLSLGLNQSMPRANWIFYIEKTFDKIEFLQKNTSFYYDKNNAVSKAENVDVADAVFFSDKYASEDSLGYLLSVDGMFIGDKLDPVKPIFPPTIPPGSIFNLGSLNSSKSRYNGIHSFEKNSDIQVELAYDNPAPMNGGGKDITDARYVRVKMQHSFIAIPKNDFRPRPDDPRVGYFGQEVDDLTSISPAPYKDFINRWNLVKKDPAAAISEPVEPIVYWVENKTPVEYRQIIKEAGEKWNEAFEKAGFKNAVVMKIMPDTATWDPADLNYNVIRWVSSSTPAYGAIGPSYVNPLTGQILGADITVEWKTGAGIPAADDLYNGGGTTALPWNDPLAANSPTTPASFGFDKNHLATCTLAAELTNQFQSGLTAIETLDNNMPEAEKAMAVKEMHKEFLYYLILHEMGHTLGLMHNMKASQMLSPAQLNDTTITRKKGLQGSVMDYPSINVSYDRNKQGDYYTTKPGPYDLWAIEYGYTPFTEADEAAGLGKILARSTEPDLAFGNDADDMRSPGNGVDPRVMINDMSNDVIAYAEDRFKLVNTMIPKLKARFSKEGQSYQLLRTRYGQLNAQRVQMAAAVSRYIGGVYVDRSFAGQQTTTKPFTPVAVEYQKKAMASLNKNIFAVHAFDVDAPLLPYLQQQRRGFNFFGKPEDVKPQTTVVTLQLAVLSELLHPVTLSRINNSTLYGNTYSVASVMNDMVKGIFNEDLKTSVNLYRQNLQTEFVKGTAAIANATAGYDNASKAAALSTLKKVKSLLAGAASPDEQTKAHRTNLNFIIDKALSVN